jgi:hypothetical protein
MQTFMTALEGQFVEMLDRSCLAETMGGRARAERGLDELRAGILRDGAGLTVDDFDEHYEIRLEPPGSTGSDEPASLIAGGAALGALAGSAFGRSRDGVLAAATLGGLLAAAFADDSTPLGSAVAGPLTGSRDRPPDPPAGRG